MALLFVRRHQALLFSSSSSSSSFLCFALTPLLLILLLLLLLQYDLTTHEAVEAATRAVNEPVSAQAAGDRRAQTPNNKKRRKIEEV